MTVLSELGENDKGEWTFKVIINNFGDEAITYNIDVLALADKPVVIGEHDGKDIIATNNESIDVTADCDITAPKSNSRNRQEQDNRDKIGC